jgi:steroid 5-alpha reductase family enzyme
MNTFYKNILNRILGYLPFLLCVFLLYSTLVLREFTLVNGAIQLFLFVLVVCIPAYITKRMSYVDIGWPWGLVCIGLLVLFFSEGYWLRTYIVGAMYLVAGLRMGIGALVLWHKGHLNKELTRYQYQRKRWIKQGYKNDNLSLQYEIMIQCLANSSFLAIPAMLQAYNPSEFIDPLELIGYCIWIIFFVLEHVADIQKQKFLKKCRLENKKRQVCTVGLWKYTRHPNYFAEWMVWNGLIISSVPSLKQYFTNDVSLIGVLLLLALVYISRIMYTTLVYYTGAIPSEYYSVQKRPNYKKHQETTPIFFPSKLKKLKYRNEND